MKEMANDDVRPIHFRINVEDIYIDSRAALSIGMIISELVSNSFKYAFKNIASPEITISFTENPTTGIMQLLVADNGNGVTGDYDSKKSLGSRLIDIFSRQLESSYTIDHKDHFIFKLHFKPISS
jgi:two-component sensor histidine kinase